MNKNLRRRKVRWASTMIVLTLLALLLFYTGRYRMTQNFAEVDPGKFYRSAQLFPAELAEVVQRYHIKTVISLRGEPPNSYWVKPQKELLEKMGVTFLAFWWHSDYFPSKEGLVGFLKALREVEYPILVHCRSGADRTGEASAIYAIDFMGVPKEKAIDDYLNYKFWHFRWFRPAKVALVQAYQGYDWAVNDYDPCDPKYKKYVRWDTCQSKK